MKKSSVFVLLIYSLFANDVMLPPYTEAYGKEALEIDSEIFKNFKNTN